MKLLFPPAVALLASVPTIALFIPPSGPPHHLSGHQDTGLRKPQEFGVAGSANNEELSVLFPISCPGCLVDIRDEVDIYLRLKPSGLACQSSNVVVNDVTLSPSRGDFSFIGDFSIASDSPVKQIVEATWTMICLDDDITLLSVQIHSISGASVSPDIGFSTSFKQINTPKILRLEKLPIHKSKCGTSNLQDWTRPQDDTEYTVLPAEAAIDNGLANKLQTQLHSLNEIKAQIARLHHKYMRQERRVFETIKQDFRTCDGATCMLQTAVKKAPDFLKLVTAHFQHRPDWKKLREQQSLFRDRRPEGPRHHDAPAFVFGGRNPFGGEGEDHRPTKPWDMIPKPEHKPIPDPFDHRKPKEFTISSLPPPPPPSPLDDHHHPSLPHGNDEEPRHRHGEHPPWAGHRGPGRHGPHFLHHHGPHQHLFVFSVGSIVFFVVVASLLFRCVRAKTGLFRNVRRTRDKASRREERRTQAAYRRAVLRHKWSSWWSQFRQPASTADYEEKRARILGQEDELENVMQSEIQDIRRAHEIVDDMMRAEGSRQCMYHEANFGSPLPITARFPVRQHTESDQTTHATLPLYQPPPPSYDQELEDEVLVVDGFNYTPSATDSTAESSDFDCTSVMSYGTGTAGTNQ